MKDFTARYRFIDSIVNLNFFGTRKLAKFFSYVIIPKPGANETIKTLLGYNIHLEPLSDHQGLEHELYYKGVYEKATISVLKSCLKEGDIFVDVGANIGAVSLSASVCVGSQGQVLAFEANPATAMLLKNNILLNGFSNINVFEFALGAEDGKGEIYPETIKNNRGGASMVKNSNTSTSIKYDISIKKLDEVIGSLRPTMIKIDVEGWELEVLKGANRVLASDSPPILIVECVLQREKIAGVGSPTEIYEFIKSINNYMIYKPNNGKDRLSKLMEIKSIAELPDHDNLFCVPKDQRDKLPKQLFV